MGYDTTFGGEFSVTPTLTAEHVSELDVFAGNRHDEPEFPGIWCQWVPTPDGKSIVWDGNEKFYEYEAWIEYLIDHFLQPWGYALNGEVEWVGEDPDDRGIIRIEDNVVKVGVAKITYQFD